MANHKSSIKRIRQTNAKRLHNRYYAKTMRNLRKKINNGSENSKTARKI